MVKDPPAKAGDARDMGAIPGLGRSPGIGNGDPLQYPCLEKSMVRGAWRATVHGVPKSQTRLSTHAHREPHHAARAAGLLASSFLQPPYPLLCALSVRI